MGAICACCWRRSRPCRRPGEPGSLTLTLGPPADLVGTVPGALDHVADALDTGLREDGADELDLADARLGIPARHGGDGTVVLDDAEGAATERLGSCQIAVLVEDPSQLEDLGL